jgi:hypothetical protein
MIMRKTVSGTEIYLYSENGADLLKVIALNAMTASQGNLLFMNSARSNVAVMSFIFSGSGKITLTQKYFIRPEFAVTQLKAVVFLNSGDFKYGGTL